MLDSAALFPVQALRNKCCCVTDDRFEEPPSDEYACFVKYLQDNKLGTVVLDLNFTEHASDKDVLELFSSFTINTALQHALAYACGIPDPANEGVL